MMTPTPLIRTLAGMTLVLMAGAASAAWSLDNDASRLSFVSVKKGTVGEVHNFDQLSGTVGNDGKVTIDIALSSVATGVAIRDERMRDMLFETGMFPKATISGDIAIKQFSQLEPGQMKHAEIPLTLSLHGKEKKLDSEVMVTRLEDDRLLVTTAKPIIVNAADFGLEKGVEALREVVSLSSIAGAVPVTFNLVFEQQD